MTRKTLYADDVKAAIEKLQNELLPRAFLESSEHQMFAFKKVIVAIDSLPAAEPDAGEKGVVISTTERLPEIGHEVLFYESDEWDFGALCQIDGKMFFEPGSIGPNVPLERVTHWMSKPVIPT